jgi:hypothetical protein
LEYNALKSREKPTLTDSRFLPSGAETALAFSLHPLDNAEFLMDL